MQGKVVTYTDFKGQPQNALVKVVNPTSEKHLTLVLADGSEKTDVPHALIAPQHDGEARQCWQPFQSMVAVDQLLAEKVKEVDQALLNEVEQLRTQLAIANKIGLEATSPEAIARVAHEVNRAYCQSIGDDSQPVWEDAPEWQKSSAIKGVAFHQDALARGQEPAPSASHDSWLAEKAAAGWKYGPVKDADLKEHPCCVPYEELPLEQRTKDYLFAAVVKALTK